MKSPSRCGLLKMRVAYLFDLTGTAPTKDKVSIEREVPASHSFQREI
jgi:hypothetical protein